MDRRQFVAGAGATIVAGPAHASIVVDRFGPTGPGAASSFVTDRMV